MKLTPWKKSSSLTPFTDDFENFFNWFGDGGFGRELFNKLPEGLRSTKMPPVDIAESETDMTVRVELAGMNDDDFDVEFLGDQLVISGERKWEEEKEEKEYHRIESQYGSFRRVVALPPGLKTEADSVKAVYKKGILTIQIPKLEPTPTKRIKVKHG